MTTLIEKLETLISEYGLSEARSAITDMYLIRLKESTPDEIRHELRSCLTGLEKHKSNRWGTKVSYRRLGRVVLRVNEKRKQVELVHYYFWRQNWAINPTQTMNIVTEEISAFMGTGDWVVTVK